MSSHDPHTQSEREVFSSRATFLFAAIGSAVGLGNIWRFPYVAFENGGGAFLIPYIVALLSAGIPLLFLYFAVGHRYRGSAPLSFKRFHPKAEVLGWFQAGICFFISVYYAVIIAWSAIYTFKSLNLAWGDDPESHFSSDFLRASTDQTYSTDIVPSIAIALVLVWVLTLGTLIRGVDKGIGRATKFFMPLLMVLFVIVVIRSLFLPGAVDGLNAFFTPEWSTLANPSVWIAAYGQIFFSLSIGFGIMVTYASYLKPRTNLTGTALVTGFANSSFEILAGIGVFAALGFIAGQRGIPVADTAEGGIGLAFIAFPTIFNEMPGGAIIATLFFASLFIAGITSLFSLNEVVISAVKDKFTLTRTQTILIVGSAMAIISLIFFSTTSGLMTLDILDKFTNNIGIVAAALMSLIITDWLNRRIGEFQLHLNAVSSFQVGTVWRMCVVNLAPVVLIIMLALELIDLVEKPYGGYTSTAVAIFGWGVLAFMALAALVLTAFPYRKDTDTQGLPGTDFGVSSVLERTLHQPLSKKQREAQSSPIASSHTSS